MERYSSVYFVYGENQDKNRMYRSGLLSTCIEQGRKSRGCWKLIDVEFRLVKHLPIWMMEYDSFLLLKLDKECRFANPAVGNCRLIWSTRSTSSTRGACGGQED